MQDVAQVVSNVPTIYVVGSGIATFFSGLVFASLRSEVQGMRKEVASLKDGFNNLKEEVSATNGFLKGKGILE